MDDSEVSLNVCVGKQFSGGELFFRGVRCDEHVNTETQPEVSTLSRVSSYLQKFSYLNTETFISFDGINEIFC